MRTMKNPVAAGLTAYGATLVPFLAMDMVWLTNTGDLLYRPYIADLIADKPDLGAAAAFYLIYMIGLTIFGSWPGAKAGSPITALRQGALFGLFAYGTYDLTNQATLKSWSIVITIADMSWGTVVSGIAAMIGSWAARRVGG